MRQSRYVNIYKNLHRYVYMHLHPCRVLEDKKGEKKEYGEIIQIHFCSKTPAPLNRTIVCPVLTFPSPMTSENSRN